MNSRKLWQHFVVAAGLMVVAAAASAQTPGGRIVEPGEEFYGRSYNELVDRWTNWFITEPFATHPAFDPDGRFCALNQDGPVWFLASTFEGIANRTCTIPFGKAIFVSLGGASVSFAPEFPQAGDPCLQLGTSLDRVRCDVNEDVPLPPDVTLTATLDGAPLQDLFAFRAQSAPGGFTLRVPDPSFITDLGLPAGNRFPAVGDGYFLYLKPLAPGLHTLTLRMTNSDQTQTGVNYRLIIQ